MVAQVAMVNNETFNRGKRSVRSTIRQRSCPIRQPRPGWPSGRRDMRARRG